MRQQRPTVDRTDLTANEKKEIQKSEKFSHPRSLFSYFTPNDDNVCDSPPFLQMNLVKQVTSTMGADKKELLRQKTEAAEAAAKEAQEATARAERLAKEVKELAEQLKSSGKKSKATKSVVSDDELKKAEESDSDSSSSSDSDSDSDEPKKTAVKPKVAAKKEESDGSSSDDSSSDDEDDKAADKMEVEKTEKDTKKEESSDSSSSDSDSSSSESEDEKEAPKAKAAAKKEESDDSSSSSDSDSEDDEEEDKAEKAPEKSNGKRKAEDSEAAAPTPKKAAVSDEATEGNKVYVRGLPWKAEEHEVQEFFAACGPIKSCEMPLMDDGRSSGTAVIEFETNEGAAAAIELNGGDFQGRWLSIKYSTPKPVLSGREPTQKQDGCVTVFVGNLAWDVDEDTLRQVFGECGEITSVRFATDRESGEFKGFGHIEFTETEATDKALAMAGTDILGRQVRVDYANDKKAGGGGGGFGGGGGGRSNDRGGRGGGRGRGRDSGGRGGRGRGGGNSFNAKKTGGIAAFAGKKISFD